MDSNQSFGYVVESIHLGPRYRVFCESSVSLDESVSANGCIAIATQQPRTLPRSVSSPPFLPRSRKSRCYSHAVASLPNLVCPRSYRILTAHASSCMVPKLLHAVSKPSFLNPRTQNLHLFHRSILLINFDQPHPLHNLHPRLDPPKNRMFTIQPRRRRQRNEKLTAVCIRPCICHTQYPSTRVSQSRMEFVFELFAVDGGTAAAGAGRVAALDHKGGDYAVEGGGVVVASAC
jgi:hypothetical protein